MAGNASSKAIKAFKVAAKVFKVAAPLIVTLTVGGAALLLNNSISKHKTSLTLYMEFKESKAVVNLLELSNRADFLHWSKHDSKGTALQKAALIARLTNKKASQYQGWLVDYIEFIALVDACIEEKTCNKKDIVLLFRAVVLEIFFGVGELIYCDAYIWDRYARGPSSYPIIYSHPKSELYKLENLVLLILEAEEEFLGSNVPIFRNRKDRDEARLIGDIPYVGRTRIVAIGRESEICKTFNVAMQVLGSSNTEAF